MNEPLNDNGTKSTTKPMIIGLVVIFVILIILAIFLIGSREININQSTDTLSEDEKAQILRSMEAESEDTLSEEEKVRIMQSLEAGNEDTLSEDEKAQILRSMEEAS
jgi:Na+-transporting methylmalonyl-CoA/oxaloacetate decarboxylase gamma subunit